MCQAGRWNGAAIRRAGAVRPPRRAGQRVSKWIMRETVKLSRGSTSWTWGRPDALDAEIVGAGKGVICRSRAPGAALPCGRAAARLEFPAAGTPSGAGNPVRTSRWSS
jgi:hypothetical protein